MPFTLLFLVAIGFLLNLKLDKERKKQDGKLTDKFKKLQLAALLSNLIGGLGCMYYFFRQITGQ